MVNKFIFPESIFVFGSNTGGFHGKGAAQYARKYLEAEQGVGEGLTGHCYALPTVGYAQGKGLLKMSLDEIDFHVKRFIDFAKSNPDLNFQLTQVGCGLAGYSIDEILPLFLNHGIPNNVFLSYTWDKHIHTVIKDRVIVAGGRDFDDWELLSSTLDSLILRPEHTVIVSGGAKGADSLGERYAEERGLDLVVMPAEWKRYQNRRSAGFIRNEKMAWFSNRLIAFWDGASSGTNHMIETARKYNIYKDVVMYGSESSSTGKRLFN
jgi:hypothetical protein